MTPVKITAAVCVNKGKIRSNNEDNFYINGQHLDSNNRDDATTIFDENSNPVAMYAVFDGMGGEEMGEEASLYAAQSLKFSHNALLGSDRYNITGAVMNSINTANDMICSKISENNGKRMGTTYALVSIRDNIATVYNVGDSRVYMMKDGGLYQISVDDTATQSLINMNLITKEEAKTHRDRNKLTQHLGIFNTEMIISPHISKDIPLEKGNRFLICSDGLTDMVSDERIREILSENKTVSEIANELVDEALLNGGRDNVTCMVIEAGNGTGPGSMTAVKKTAVIVFALILVVFAVVATIVYLNSKDESDKSSVDKPAFSEHEKQMNAIPGDVEDYGDGQESKHSKKVDEKRYVTEENIIPDEEIIASDSSEVEEPSEREIDDSKNKFEHNLIPGTESDESVSVND